MKNLILLCCITIIALSIGCGGAGFGQSFDSPDGKYKASATPYQTGILRIEYRIRDNETGATIWRHDQPSSLADPPYGAGFGNYEYIQWSGDSTEVRFAIKCRETTDPVQWIAAVRKENAFAEGVRKRDGLRLANRLER